METTNTTHIPTNEEIELMGPVSLHMMLIEASEAMADLWNDEGGWEQAEAYEEWARVEDAVMACLNGRAI